MELEEEYISRYFGNNTYLDYKNIIDITYNIVEKYIDKTIASKQEKNRWKILNIKYKNAFLSSKRTHLFRTCTGSGKTVTSVLWVKIITKLYETLDGFLVLSYEYEHGTNEVERIILKHGSRVDYIKFEGKNRLCTQLKTIINERGDTIEKIMKYGISVKPFCENDCPDRETCIYMGNCRQAVIPVKEGGIKNIISVHHQLGAFIPIYLMHVKNIMLIMDEDFTDGIKVSNRYGVPTLRKNLKFINLVLEELERRKKEDDDFFKSIIMKFKELLTKFLDNIYRIDIPLNYKKIDDIISFIDIIISDSNYYIEKLDNIAYSYIRKGRIKPFRFMFGELSNFIKNYEYEKMNDEIDPETKHFIEWREQAFYKRQDKFLITFLYYDKCLLEKIVFRENIEKIIINDATANINILTHIFGKIEPIEEHNEDWLYEKCKIYQLRKIVKNKENRKYAHYPKSSFFYETTFNYLMDDIKVILMKHCEEPVLIVAREVDGERLPFNGKIPLSEYIHLLGHSDVLFDEYPLAGTNIYSNVNVVIILGKPDLPNHVIKRQSALIGMKPELYRKSYSKNMMLQAMGRILRGDKQKYIYILTGFDLELKQDIISLRSHTDFRNYIMSEIKKVEKKQTQEDIFYSIKTYISINEKITIKECESLLNVSNSTAKRLLNKYVKEKKLRLRKEAKNKSIFYI